MKIIRIEDEGEHVPAPIPEVSGELYGDLFRAADWAVLQVPWEKQEGGVLFELISEKLSEKWQATLSAEASICLLALVRMEGKTSGSCNRLEIQFMASDFLQGHDYELNVRYAPESWDEQDKDILVLRARTGQRAPEHPTAEQVELLTEALRRWEQEFAS